MAVCWFLCLAVFSYPLSAERVAHKRILHEADSFLTRGHGAREFEQQKKQTKETSNGTRTEAKDPISLGEDPAQLRQMGKYLQALAGRLEHRHHDYNHGDHDKVGLPKCSDGILQLDGVYEVKKPEEVLVEGPSCLVTGSAELHLWAPVRFQGSLVLAGQLNVKAAGGGGRVNAYAPCVAIEGNFALHPEARLSIQGCQNLGEFNLAVLTRGASDKGHAGKGGCLHIGGDADLLGGQLLLHECNARKGLGGGMHVKGRLESRSATIDAGRCDAMYGGAIAASNNMNVSGGKVTITESAARSGGAIYAWNMMDVSGGSVTITKSEALKDGGAIMARSMDVSGGNVTITESEATINGGAIAAQDMNVSGGSVSIRESAAKYAGGAIRAWSMHVSGGGVTITKSEALKDGGAVRAFNNMIVSGGNVTITESKASKGGGAVYAENMKVSGGNVTITKSEALQDGGAVYAENMIVSGGGVSINEAEARYDGGCIYTLYDFTNPGGAVSFEGCKALHEGGDIFSRGNKRQRR